MLRESWLKEKLLMIESGAFLDFLPVRELNTNLKRLQGLETSVKAQVSVFLFINNIHIYRQYRDRE